MGTLSPNLSSTHRSPLDMATRGPELPGDCPRNYSCWVVSFQVVSLNYPFFGGSLRINKFAVYFYFLFASVSSASSRHQQPISDLVCLSFLVRHRQGRGDSLGLLAGGGES